MDEATARAAAHWDEVSSRLERPARTRWWSSPTITRHINKRVCGVPIDGAHAGFHRWLGQTLSRSAARGLSIGCGNGHKEIALVKAGIVENFDLYEISTIRVAEGRRRVAAAGLSDRIKFHVADAFASQERQYDLVYWNNALHHMMDTNRAIQWSRDRLLPGGSFAMDEFVGPTRFQWTQKSIDFGTLFRSYLDEHQRTHPSDPKRPAKPIERPTIEFMLSVDPSEAADSDSIIPAFRRTFPTGEIRYTGGAIYHLALNGILTHLDEDSRELRDALALDDALSAMGENHYAVAIASV